MPRILLVTPAPPGSQKGNRLTANRWAEHLRRLGHQLRVIEEYDKQECDLLFTLHAKKSSKSIERFRIRHPARPTIVTLTGTDLYADIKTNRSAQRSLETATRLVVLQACGLDELPPRYRHKTRVVLQSAQPPLLWPPPLKSSFEICVCGHLRPVKDPFRAAIAVRQLPSDSKIRITHVGAALTPSMKHRAEREMQTNKRYRWLGETPHEKTKQLIARSRVLVLSSKMEGGANVVSEAIAAQTPVISSRISGSIGLLGEDYSGYFEVGDTHGLTRLLLRCEVDIDFVDELQKQCQLQADRLTPEHERESLKQLINELTV